MVGQAMYRDEMVVVIDMVWNPAKSQNDYLINYDGPVWVGEDDLSGLVMIISA